jgi:tryptophan-rich sensory protein
LAFSTILLSLPCCTGPSATSRARGRGDCLTLALCVMLSNELWNYLCLGLQSTLARFVGKVLFLVPLSALVFALYEHERPSAGSLTPYYLWVLYDLA